MILRTLTFTVTIESTGPPELLAALSPLFLPAGQAPEPAAAGVPGPLPAVPDAPALPRTFLSPTPCPLGHRDNDTGQVLRYRGSNRCFICAKEHPPRRRARVNGQRPVRAGSAEAERPELPAHLAQTAFLSPITCEIETHRYRDSRYTLRYLNTEGCVQCVTQTHTLVGD